MVQHKVPVSVTGRRLAPLPEFSALLDQLPEVTGNFYLFTNDALDKTAENLQALKYLCVHYTRANSLNESSIE